MSCLHTIGIPFVCLQHVCEFCQLFEDLSSYPLPVIRGDDVYRTSFFFPFYKKHVSPYLVFVRCIEALTRAEQYDHHYFPKHSPCLRFVLLYISLSQSCRSLKYLSWRSVHCFVLFCFLICHFKNMFFFQNYNTITDLYIDHYPSFDHFEYLNQIKSKWPQILYVYYSIYYYHNGSGFLA